MGVGSSQYASGAHQELLDRLSSSESVAVADPFWKDLLTFPAPLTKFDPVLLQQSLSDTCSRLGGGKERDDLPYY